MNGATKMGKCEQDYCIKLSSKYDTLVEGLTNLSLHIDKKILFKNMSDNVKKLVDADHVHIRIIDWIDKKLVLEKYVGDKDNRLKHARFISINDNEGIAGYVFTTQEPCNIEDAQQNEYLLDYIKTIKKIDNEESKNLVGFLESIGPAIVVPLHLKSKPIGVITALRIKKGDGGEPPAPFSDEDLIFLKHFANQASVAIRNAWLLEAATWQPSKQGVYSVDELCQEIVKEVINRTGAADGRVRFVNWNNEYLVPGALEWHNNVKRDSRVYIRKIGVYPVGRVVERRAPILINELQADPAFRSFQKFAVSQEESYHKQLNVLQALCSEKDKRSIALDDDLIKKFIMKCKNMADDSLSSTNEELKKRLDMLLDEPTSKEREVLIKKHIELVNKLADEWKKYVENDVEKWKSELAVPILIKNKAIGVLNVHSDKNYWFIESDLAILQALAGRVATAILEHQETVLNKIHKIEQEMTANQSVEDLASMTAKGIREVAFLAGPEKASKIFPLLYICKKPMSPQRLVEAKDDFSEKFEPRAPKEDTTQDERDLLNTRIRGDGLGFQAIEQLSINISERSDEPAFIVRENVDDPLSGGSKSAQKKGVITTACIPVVIGNIVYGILYIHIKERHFFTKMEKDALTLFATHAAIILKNFKRSQGADIYDDLCGRELIQDCINHHQSRGRKRLHDENNRKKQRANADNAAGVKA